MQAYTIRLSINENLKLEKEKEKKSSAAQCFIQSSHHVTAICGNLWQFASTVTLSKFFKTVIPTILVRGFIKRRYLQGRALGNSPTSLKLYLKIP